MKAATTGLARVHGAVVDGVRATVVLVEVDIAQGLPSVGLVGLAGTTVDEARWRVRSAVGNSGAPWPPARITIGLSPADLPKAGTGLDLAIAVGVLSASGHVPRSLGDLAFLGELGLDGTVRPIRGALAAAQALVSAGIARVMVSPEDASVVSLLPDVTAIPVATLVEALQVLRGERTAMPASRPAARPCDEEAPDDLADVRGHRFARYGLEVAATGGHHCALVGPPGVGKSMLAGRLVTILPDLEGADAIDVTTVHSLTRTWRVQDGLITRPVLQAPHHSTSAAAVLGSVRGGQVIPGAVTLAHRGVLLLDEAPEFSRPCLEGLRQPMESGEIHVHRVGRQAVLPARCQVVLTANPCACGFAIDDGRDCTCTPMARKRYRERLSGPLMDRVDVRITAMRPGPRELMAEGEPSSVVRARVLAARARAARRFADAPWRLNAEVPAGYLRRRLPPDDGGVQLLESASGSGASLRGLDRVLRMAWSIADLAGVDRPGAGEIAAALGLRGESTEVAA